MQNLKFLLKTFISLLILCGAVYLIEVDNIIAVLSKIDFFYVFLAIICGFLCRCLISLRWCYLIKNDVSTFNCLYLLKVGLWGIFLNSFIPANIGNDIYRFKTTLPLIYSKTQIISLLVKERIIGLIVLFLLSFVAFIPHYLSANPVNEILLSIELLFFLSILGATTITFWGKYFLYVFHKILPQSIHSFINNILTGQNIFIMPNALPVWLLAMAGQFSFILSIYIVAYSMQIPISLTLLCIIVPLVELARLVALTIQGIGVREAVFAWGFTLIALPSSEGFALGAVSYALLAVTQLLAGGVSFLMPYKIIK